MKSVGLTGNVASGKSTVAGVWREEGVPVIDADRLAREVVEPGTPGLARVVEVFGQEVLAPDGTLDRDRMRRRVFRDPGLRRRLEAILHPLVRERRARWVEEQARAGHPLAVSEVPLLFEAGMEEDFDVVVFVDAPEDLRLARLMRSRGLSREDAETIVASQDPPGPKRRAADHVLVNEGSPDELRARARALLDELLRTV